MPMERQRWVMIGRLIGGVVLGGIAGFALYRFIGCSGGGCPITSNPWISVLYGMVMGAVLSQTR
jgi:hypothetical protein